MGSKKAVTVENLAALGSDRLVGILMALDRVADRLARSSGTSLRRSITSALTPLAASLSAAWWCLAE
jgi:hypothetical protein